VLSLLGTVLSLASSGGVTLTLAPDAPCISAASLTRQLDAMGVQVVTRQAVLDVDVTGSGASLRLRARRRGDEQLLLRTVPAKPEECAAAERVVALLIRSWVESAHLSVADAADAGPPADPNSPTVSPEIAANPLAGIELPKPAPPPKDDTPAIPQRPLEPARKKSDPPRPTASSPVPARRIPLTELTDTPAEPLPPRLAYPSGTDEGSVTTAQALIEARAPKAVTGLALRDETPAEGSVTDPQKDDLTIAERPSSPPSPVGEGGRRPGDGPDELHASTSPAPSTTPPWAVRVALLLGGEFGVADGATFGGEWIIGISRGHLAVWLDVGLTLGPSAQTQVGQVDLSREWASVSFGAIFHPTQTLEWGAGLGVRGFRLGAVYAQHETDLIAAGGVVNTYLSLQIAGPFSLWLRGFFTLRGPRDRLTTDGGGTILVLQPWDAGAEGGVGLRFE